MGLFDFIEKADGTDAVVIVCVWGCVFVFACFHVVLACNHYLKMADFGGISHFAY